MLTLITDRTKADVDEARALLKILWEDMTADQRAQYRAGLKGVYQASDLNRVGAAVAELQGRFHALGYAVSVEPRTDWTNDRLPTPEELERYLDDLRALRAVLTAPEDLPAVPESMEKLTYEAANDIEQLLLDLEFLIEQITPALIYSGEVLAGEV